MHNHHWRVQGRLPHDRVLSVTRSSRDQDDLTYRAGGDRCDHAVPRFSCYREDTQALIPGTEVALPPRSPYSVSGYS